MPGLYYVSASAPAHYPAHNIDTLFIEQNTHISDLDIYLTPYDSTAGVFLSGYVLTADSMNFPVHPAMIKLTTTTPDGDSIVIRKVNNPDGSYAFMNLIPGIYDAEVKAHGFDPVNISNLDLTSGNIVYNFYMSHVILPPVNYIAGRTLNLLDGSPVPQARVKLSSLNSFSEYETFSDYFGKYKFHAVIPGLYMIQADKPGYNPSFPETLQVDINSQIDNLIIKMAPTDTSFSTTLFGIVKADSVNSGGVVHPAQITVLGYSPFGDSLVYIADNEPDGTYKINHIRRGTYTVFCKAQGYHPQSYPQVPITGDSLRIDFYLRAIQPVSRGLISGNVFLDGTNQPVQYAFIEFISNISMLNYHTITNQNGYYEALLPQGEYLVLCKYMSPDSFFVYREFYDNVQSIQQATSVNVADGDTTTGVDFGIPHFSGVSEININGIVTDENNNPLDSALVKIWPRNPHFSINDSSQFYAITDAQGNYSINMQFNHFLPFYKFIVSAKKPGYNIEFYQEKPVHYLADLLMAYSDSVFNDINFTLDQQQLNNSISGVITNIDGYPVKYSFVIASNINSGQIRFAFSDAQGHYSISALENDSYYLLFLKIGYIPEFYDDVLLWEDATPVFASGNITGIDASLEKIIPDSGNGMLAGKITDMQGNPLSGATVILKGVSGETRGYAFSGPDGNYELESISDGEYKIIVSLVSYESQETSVYFSNTLGSVLIVDFSLDKTVVKINQEQNENQLPSDFELYGNFPNPFNPRTTISFGLPHGQYVKLVVYNLLGQQVKVLVDQYLSAGSYEADWDGLDNLGNPVSSGIYFYSLETMNNKLVRKMIFSK